MYPDTKNEYRTILENDPPAFFDRVNTPWDQVPDLEDYNLVAYQRIVRALNGLSRSTVDESGSNTKGILILGDAGTGKTHLLMRVARNLAETNHILFVRKPNNEDAVAQHIWANVVNSLAKSIPAKNSIRSQLDDLLAHVFSKVLIPQFEQDIQEDKDADQKLRWVNRLKEDPYNLFSMLGEGEKRESNRKSITNRTLKYLQFNHPDVDQAIARAFITYCFVVREDRKRILLTWLSGQDVDEAEAREMGLQPWVSLDESSSDASIQQQREEQALRAVRTVGILSTYYQPLILAFDQLEGLRGQDRLTNRWGDVVREIFTMAPNFLIITCIFPSLWDEWFSSTLDQSVTDRIAQQKIMLDTFGSQHGLNLLATHLKPSFDKHRLPTNIFPFTNEDIANLCTKASSPRSFIQAANQEFQKWLDGSPSQGTREEGLVRRTVAQADIDEVIRSALDRFEGSLRKSFACEMVVEQDFFGRIRTLIETLLASQESNTQLVKATCQHFVMPPNVVVKDSTGKTSLCIAVMNSEGTSFAARMRNLNKCAKEGSQFTRLLLIRDRRCRKLGQKGQEHLDEARSRGSTYVEAGQDEMTCLNAVYETFVAAEEHDLSVAEHEIEKRQVVAFLRHNQVLSKTELFRHASKMSQPLAQAVGLTMPEPAPHQPQRNTQEIQNKSRSTQPEAVTSPPSPFNRLKAVTPTPKQMADIVLGDDVLNSPHVGILGELRDGRKRLGISLTKPQCLVLLGYMGSGKSYALGVLIENALLVQPGLIEQTRPMCVVAFNYRKNSQARFEHVGFSMPNSRTDEVKTLATKYGAMPQAVGTVNIFGYKEELPRRVAEYGGLRSLPIQFRPDELGADHWEILMKPPSPEAEYMDIIRDIIQKLYYEDRLTFKTLDRAIQTDERMSPAQRRRAMNRLRFAERWISDSRPYEWTDVLAEGSLNIFDLRMQAMESAEALKLCLIITDLVRRTKNGVNKLVVFDEAHEYVDSKVLVGELQNAITQIRHDGLSFILASQFPDRIPESIFKYLLTRFIFKLPNAKAINYVRRSAPNLESISPQKVANLDLEQGVCFVQTDEVCTDELMKIPQMMEVRPRCTMHGGATIRQVDNTQTATASESGEDSLDEFEDLEPDLCPECGDELKRKARNGEPVMVCNSYPRCKYYRKA
jgi:Cdc6-like AAA superfamily ATPase